MGVFEKAIISAEEITEFIPQRPPIVMVDQFFGLEDSVSRSGLTVDENNIFCENGALSDCGVIEHIAQSAALRMGYIYKSEGKEVPLGFIGSVNQLRLYHLPKIGESIQTEVRIEQEVMNITLISAVCSIAGEKVAECKMKIFLQE